MHLTLPQTLSFLLFKDIKLLLKYGCKYCKYGLNPEFDQVRVQILGKTETSSLDETISKRKYEKYHA